MTIFTSVLAAMLFIACGTDLQPRRPQEPGPAGQDGVDGAQGPAGKDGACAIPTIVVPTPVAPANPTSSPTVFTGVYLLPNGGTLELVEDFNRAVLLIGTQRIKVENSDHTLGTLPSLSSSARHVRVNDNTVIIDTTVKFKPSNGITALGLSADANRRVMVSITRRADKKLAIVVHIYDAAGTGVAVLERQVSQ